MFSQRKRFNFRFTYWWSAVIVLLLFAGCTSIPVEGTEQQEPSAQEEQQSNERQVKFDMMNRYADEMYNAAKEGKFADAREHLLNLAELVTKTPFEGTISIEGVQAFAAAIVKAKEVYNAVNLSPEQALFASGQLRLATDALTHPNNPMWLQYYKILKEDLNVLTTAVKQNQKELALQAVERWRQHYSMIRPAVWMTREASVANQADSMIVFLQNQLSAPKPNYAAIDQAIESFQLYLDRLFERKDSPAYLPIADQHEPILWSIGLAAIILSVLGYVAYRKFQFERDYTKVDRDRRERGI